MKFIFYLKLINIRAKNSKPTRLQESAPLEKLLHSAAHLIYLYYPNIPPKFPYRIGCVSDTDMHLIWTRYVSKMPVGISGYMAYPFSFDTVQQLIRAYKDTWHIPCPSIHYRIRLIRAGYSRDIDGIHFKFLGFQFSPLDVQSKSNNNKNLRSVSLNVIRCSFLRCLSPPGDRCSTYLRRISFILCLPSPGKLFLSTVFSFNYLHFDPLHASIK